MKSLSRLILIVLIKAHLDWTWDQCGTYLIPVWKEAAAPNGHEQTFSSGLTHFTYHILILFKRLWWDSDHSVFQESFIKIIDKMNA